MHAESALKAFCRIKLGPSLTLGCNNRLLLKLKYRRYFSLYLVLRPVSFKIKCYPNYAYEVIMLLKCTQSALKIFCLTKSGPSLTLGYNDRLLLETKYRRLPVVDGNGKLVS